MEEATGLRMKDWVKTIIIALILSFLLEKFLITFTVVSGDSMMATLSNEDRLVIDKISHKFLSIDRGEIIIFKPPIYGRDDEIFVKRVIAIAGDTYKIKYNKFI